MRIEEVLNETAFKWPFPPISQMTGSGGAASSSVDPMPFWLYGGFSSNLSDPKTPVLRLLLKMKQEPMPENEKLNYAERNLLDQSLGEGLVELSDKGYHLTDRGRKYLDSFDDVTDQLVNAVPFFYLGASLQKF